MEDRARTVGLFRYSLIRQAADPALSTAASGGCWCASWPQGSIGVPTVIGCG